MQNRSTLFNQQNKEEQAAARLRLRLASISDRPVDESEVKEHAAKIEKLYDAEMEQRDDLWALACAPVLTFRKALYIEPKADAKHLTPKLITLNYTNESQLGSLLKESFFCYDVETNRKVAGVGLRKQDNYMFIEGIKSMYASYRFGSILIQAAIERSIQQRGFDGRIELSSQYKSGQFYFKLGFLPLNQHVYAALLDNQDVDGGWMYLPKPSIDAWKEKIIRNPLILSEQEVKQLCETLKIHVVLKILPALNNINDDLVDVRIVTTNLKM